MKKERNCNCNMNPYPVYPMYPGMMPQGAGQMMPQGINPNMGMYNGIVMPTVPNSTMGQSMSGAENQISAMNSQIASLERRVSRLEAMTGSSSNISPKYSESNYYMV